MSDWGSAYTHTRSLTKHTRRKSWDCHKCTLIVIWSNHVTKSLRWYFPANAAQSNTNTSTNGDAAHCGRCVQRGNNRIRKPKTGQLYNRGAIWAVPMGTVWIVTNCSLFYDIPPLGGVWGILKPGRWSHHRADWWWWCMRDITFSSKTPAPLSYFSGAEVEKTLCQGSENYPFILVSCCKNLKWMHQAKQLSVWA